MCMFLGYAKNHTGGTYHMLNLRSKRIVLSHEVICVKKPKKSWYQEYNIPTQTPMYYKMKTSPIIELT